jgi:hypothetical protein
MRKFLLAYTMLAALGAPAMADPFVSGSEPGWGNKMSAKQRRQIGFDDVRTALKYNRKPEAPTKGVPGYAFNVITIRHNSGGKSGSGGGGGGRVGQGYGTGADIGSGIPPASSPFVASRIKSEPFGVFATLQECDVARAAKIAELDDRDQRFPHQQKNPPVISRTVSTYGDGQTTSQNGQTNVSIGPLNGQYVREEYAPSSPERMDVTFCEPGIYSPGQSLPNIAEGDQTTGAATQTTTLEVPPGFVKHWVAPRPFARVIPGTADAIEVLSASGRDLVFTVKPDNSRPTNILLVNDNGDVVANLRIVIPGTPNSEIHQGPDGSQVYRKDNPDYVAPKEKK